MRVLYDFPDDENGDVLRRMQEGGDDLAEPRDIDFTVMFPDESSAEDVRELLQRSGFKVSVEEWGGKRERPWDVTVTRHMLPDHQGITEFETSLEEVAAPLAGANDGWGCIRQSPHR